MLSAHAFAIADCIVLSGFSLHDLLATAIHFLKVPRDQVDAYLHDGLRELIAEGWATWEFEPDYGNALPQKRKRLDTQSFESDWEKCVASGPLREGIPDSDNPTLFIEATDELLEEMRKPEYD